MRAVIHFINRWGRTKDRLGDLKQKQQELINKSKDLLPPPPPPGGNGNGHGPAAGTPTPPPVSPPQPIDVSMNGSQPLQPAEPTGPQAQQPHQPPQQPQPQPEDQAKGADENG